MSTKPPKLDNQRPESDAVALREALRDHERDLQFLAYDIHDGLLQYIIGALIHLESIETDDGAQRERTMATLELVRELMRQALSEGRRLIRGARPPILEQRGLAIALHDLIETSSARASIPINLTIELSSSKYSPLLEGSIYRITQEALNNVCSHSQTEQASITLLSKGDWLQLEIRDFGVGFDLSSIRDESRGILGIRNRAKWLGGKCEIVSNVGQGTHITVRLPVHSSSIAFATRSLSV